MNTLLFVFINFSKHFLCIENQDYKNENIEKKYLEIMEYNTFLKVQK